MFNKKGAMFGLCRVLRKQFGELFLTSRQSETPQGVNGSIKTKRGAMFGLDARIALAIFGALSVISGAALYSAIKQAKVTALLTEIQELIKSLEQYYLDVGSLPSKYNIEEILSSELVVSSQPGWNGPYLANMQVKDHYLENSLYNLHFYYLDKSNNFGGVSSDYSQYYYGRCQASSSTKKEDCFLWLYIDQQDSLEIGKKIDDIVDGGDGFKSGDFRVSYNSSYPHIKYRYILNTGINYPYF